MFGIGMTELVVIFVIGLLVLGPKRLPAMARSLGRTLAEFRRASADLRQDFLDVREDVRIEPPADPPAPDSAETPASGEEPVADAKGTDSDERPSHG